MNSGTPLMPTSLYGPHKETEPNLSKIFRPLTHHPPPDSVATKQQREDLMNFRETGEKEFEKYVEYNILHKPSTKTPNRKCKLLTLSHRKANKARLNQEINNL